MRRLNREQALLVVIDVQEKLARVIDEIELVERNIERLVLGAGLLGVPILVTEQYPQGIGGTTSGVRQALDDVSAFEPIQKTCFSSWGCREFADAVTSSGRSQIILSGIEAHVCVYQTCLDLLDSNLDVWLVGDAVSSRTPQNRAFAIQRLTAEGARLTTTEMALFEMTVEAGTNTFKAISKLVK